MIRLLSLLNRLAAWWRTWPQDQPELPDGYEGTADSAERAELDWRRDRRG